VDVCGVVFGTEQCEEEVVAMGWTIYSLSSGLGKYREKWDFLNRDLYAGHPFFDSRFIDLMLEHFGSGREKLCIHSNDEDVIDGLLILVRRRFGIWSLFLPSQAQIAPVLVKNPIDLNELFRDLPGYAVLLELLNQDTSFSTVQNVKERDYLPVYWQPHVTTINVNIEGDFETYWKGRSKNLQKNMRRYRNRIENDAGGERLEVHTDEKNLARALARYGEIESRGWKEKLGTAIHYKNKQGAFYLSLLQNFASDNGSMAAELYIGSKLVASRLCIKNESSLIILKTTYDEEFSSFAPGRVLLYLLLEREFNLREVKTIEFYTNATDEQIAWSTGLRSIDHVSFFRNRVLRLLYIVLREKYVRFKPAVEVKSKIADVEQTLVYREFEKIDDLPVSFRALIEAHDDKRFDFEFAWFQLLTESGLAADSRILLAGVDSANSRRAEALVPLMYQPGKHRLEALGTFYTSLFSPFVRKRKYKNALRHLFSGIRNDPRKFSIIDLHPLPYDDTVYEITESALQQAGWITFRYFCFGNWYFPVDCGSYEDYFKALPSALRNTIDRKSRKFYEQNNGRIDLYFDGESLDKAIEDYEKIYRSSWKVQEPFPEFIPGLIRTYANKGHLRLALAYVDGEPAAAQIWIVSHGRAAVYKLAYDEKFSNLSVGTILTDYLMRHVIDVDHVNEVDYLIGDEIYKRDWMSHRRERWGIVAYNPSTIRGILGVINEFIRRQVKSYIKILRSK